VDFAGLVSKKLSGTLVVRITEGRRSYDGGKRKKNGGNLAATVSSQWAGLSTIFYLFRPVLQGRCKSLKLLCGLLQAQHLNLLSLRTLVHRLFNKIKMQFIHTRVHPCTGTEAL